MAPAASLFIYFVRACARVCVQKKGRRGEQSSPGGAAAPTASLVPGATGATVTVRIQPRALGSEVFFGGGGSVVPGLFQGLRSHGGSGVNVADRCRSG